MRQESIAEESTVQVRSRAAGLIITKEGTLTKQEEICTRLDELEEEDGFLDLDTVVSTAKNPNDILHQYFTWDDTKAAHEHRKAQARALIRSVHYVEKTTKIRLDVPKYVQAHHETHRPGYQSLDRVLQEKKYIDDTLNDELKRAQGNLKRALIVASTLNIRERLKQALALVIDALKSTA